MVKAGEWNVLYKILFATDFPITTVQETITAFHQVNRLIEGMSLPRVPEEAIEQIIHRDALALLGLA